MIRPDQSSRDYWREVLLQGGFTTVPRWTVRPTPTVREHQAVVPRPLQSALQDLARAWGVPVGSLLLAAHAKVLAALSGESPVTTGYLGSSGPEPLPCRMTTAADSWRGLVWDSYGAESAVQAHQDVALDQLRRELGLTAGVSETLWDPTGGDGDLIDDAVLRVSLRLDDEPLLRLRYRGDALDADAAARVAGYHLRALELLAADPDADHRRQSLLSEAERELQIEGLAGRRRELPDRRMHELFEQQVRDHPDAVAARCGDREVTYAELNARANRLGRALLARGLVPEGVVAVVTERNLDWMAAVLAVFKAGGAYLPVEPHFPADRINAMLTRARCRLVLTETGSTATLGPALDDLPEVEALLIEEASGEGHADADLGVRVAAHQLAYLYFTSGSTGEPKGAMCEHAGMLNHLFAKIDDLGIDDRTVVAQTAPQCFDISLWQLVSALLVGGRTLLVAQSVVLDVERFVDTVVGERVAVLQLVPSYLEAVLTYLEKHPRALPELRCVSVTGEAVKKELTQRWFATQPAIPLVNAYGLTETSDDTNHEVLHRVPDSERVPLGRPVSNVHVYIVDEHLSPVPLGAPGAIVFSGVCVGRGYVNDPERTRLAFSPDPHRPGERLYQAGDYGRWLPDGKLDFLGRRDSQVKISGFRIEIGEIENALLQVPGVRDGAVVVTERPDQGRQLVGFYSATHPMDADLLRARLADTLPHYMVPRILHWRPALPLTANSKIDKRTLTTLAAELAEPEVRHAGPRTPTERRLAAAWSTVLGIPEDQIGRSDHFFDAGGSSLSAVKLAIALDRAVSHTDVTRHPVLSGLAAVLDGRAPDVPVDQLT